jgi:hypothetical protein
MLQKDMGTAVAAWPALEALVYMPHTDEAYRPGESYLSSRGTRP